MMDSIASAAMSMSAAQFSVQYSTAMQKKAMETVELAAEELLEGLDAEYKRLIDEYTAGGGSLPWAG